MSHQLVDPLIMKAIEQFTAKVTVPMLCEDEDPWNFEQIGTGTFLNIDDRLFLVTARHLFDKADPANFAIPNPTTTKLQTLGRCDLFKPTDEAVDVVVLELLEESAIQHAMAGWRALTLENVAQASPLGTFLLCGYPSERAKKVGEKIGGSLVSTYSQRMTEVPDDATPPIDPELDLFFYYDDEAIDVDGRTISTPHLGGTSGASVWQYADLPGSQLWAAERCLKIVGVQSAFRKGRYFRAKSWGAILAILRQADARLAETVNAFFSRSTKSEA